MNQSTPADPSQPSDGEIPTVGSPGGPLPDTIVAMRTRAALALAASAGLVAGLLAAVRARAVPLGVPGEWEWLRVAFGPSAIDLALASAGVAAYAGFAAVGSRALRDRATRAREAVALALLVPAAVGVQAVAQTGAPVGHGLEKCVFALSQAGSSGYFLVARDEARDLPRFLADYPRWIQGQDALHIGTHPPGLIAAEAALLHALQARPAWVRFVESLASGSVARTFQVFGSTDRRPLAPADRATVLVTAFLTLLACGATVVPLYALARATLPARSAWSAACLWPLVPSAVLFQPIADTAFPLLSTAALALTAWACRTRGVLGVAAGVVLGVGMQFSLVFLAVGLVAGVVIVAGPGPSLRGKLTTLLAVGAGFLATTGLVWAWTGADPFVTWWWNQKNHARFYEEFPRTYRAWVVANTIELAVGLGLPVSVWAAVGLARRGGAPRVALATLAVLAYLTLGGRNLSEVARIWLPFLPALAVASAAGIDRAVAGPVTLGATVALLGAQTLGLQAMVQVVYPV